MDMSQCCCPNKEYEDYGKKGQGNIVCYDTYGKHKTKLLRCRTCKSRFSERRNTVFFGLHLDEENIERVVRCLAEGNTVSVPPAIVKRCSVSFSQTFTLRNADSMSCGVL